MVYITLTSYNYFNYYFIIALLMLYWPKINAESKMSRYQTIGDRSITPNSFRQVSYTVLSIATAMALSYTFSDTVVVAGEMTGRLPGDSQNNLATSALVMAMLTTLVSIAEATVFSMNIYTNNRRGQLEEKLREIGERGEDPTPEETIVITGLRNEISSVLKAGIMLNFPFVPVPMALMCFSQWTLGDIFGQDPLIAQQAQSFLRPYTYAIPAITLMRMPLEQILFSYEKQLLVMILALASFGIGTGFAYLFCFGNGTVPEMGLSGIAYGFLIESYLTPILFALALYFNQSFKDLNFFGHLCTASVPLKAIKELAKSGLPMLATTTSQVAAPFIINMLAGQLDNQHNTGSETLAAQSFSSWLSFGLVIPLLALGQAIAQGTNRKLGEAQEHFAGAKSSNQDAGNEIFTNATRAARYGLATAGLIMTAICLAIIIAPQIVTSLVSNQDASDGSVIPIAQTTVRITAVGIIFNTLANAMLQILRSLKDNNAPTALSIVSQWLGVSLSYVLAFTADLGIYGLALGGVIGNALNAITLALRFWPRTEEAALSRVGEANEVPLMTQLSCLGSCSCSLLTWGQHSPQAEDSQNQPIITTSIENQ